ncbi:dentin sialophosphoprotein [Sitodiplosis mosellana]|uniref:dentin sialophosphoprotein n=1 Tax=Sitodiplosis mosellana TaxID=263140 RepID=UPI002444983B|nr:dentin sialophosphoprotein [Sitodiplosis mosellana]
MTSPPKITAEWIVRAQLTICRPDTLRANVQNQQQDTTYSIERPQGIERHFDNENPIKVIYKWSSSDANTGDASSVVETVLSAPNASNLSSKDSGSFRSTGVTSSDSGIGTTTTSTSNQIDNSKYHSTCNIILTACTNIIPEQNEIAESFPTTYYTLFPDNEHHSVQSNLSKANILSVRDAFSQTSDIESKKYSAPDSTYNSQETLHPQQHTKHSKERNLTRGSPPSSSNLATPPVFSPPSSSGTKPVAKKPSRTVHIDVYCTGSDAEDSCSSDSSSSSNSIEEPNVVELESNSTPQTVYDSNQLKLHHTRVNDTQGLPRRIVASNQHDYMQNASYSNLRDYLLAQCDSRDEVTESKQMLFEKHVGGQSIAKPSRFSNSRNRFNLHREQSDDCISSNYPNSSHSTVRDLTCSSISSVMAASSSAVPDDLESSWKETDMDNSTKGSSICPSDSFDYDNRSDRWRIRQMEDAWKEKEKRWRMFSSSIMHDSIEEKELADDSNHDHENVPTYEINQDQYQNVEQVDNVNQHPNTFPEFFSNEPAPQIEAFDVGTRSRPMFGRGKSMELPVINIQERMARPATFWLRSDFEPHNEKRKSPAMIPGYTRQHLLRAQKFGSVIETIRKPGHHVGPAKNPDCKCEYCRRWFAERSDHFRERASSLDITFIGGLPNRRYTRNY